MYSQQAASKKSSKKSDKKALKKLDLADSDRRLLSTILGSKKSTNCDGLGIYPRGAEIARGRLHPALRSALFGSLGLYSAAEGQYLRITLSDELLSELFLAF